ncbi:MAG: DUF423 domain-containing protein [Proteobacteria bacterium]|nr:DUF423 domain-containing protein [Pseudomonadota bacterium]
MIRYFFFLGGLLGGLGVVFGAFGGHTLKARLTPELLATFETGVRYQMVHALVLLIVALAPLRKPALGLLAIGGWLFVTGIVLFSGSLYLIALSGLRVFGAITPLGGIAFICGWFIIALTAFRGYVNRQK